MININNVKRYCCDDISLIENYDKAVNDKTQTWDCHHRAEILPCGNYSRDDLKKFGLYFDRPADELIFLTASEHLSLHMTGNIFSDEHKTKLSQAHKGKKHSEEHKKNIGLSVKNSKKKQVRQLSLDGDLIAEFASITQAYKITKIKKYNISQVCNGKTHTAGGFKWEFADE